MNLTTKTEKLIHMIGTLNRINQFENTQLFIQFRTQKFIRLLPTNEWIWK